MENHSEETTMLRNACLTISHFDIPKDMLFAYDRVVAVLLNVASSSDFDICKNILSAHDRVMAVMIAMSFFHSSLILLVPSQSIRVHLLFQNQNR